MTFSKTQETYSCKALCVLSGTPSAGNTPALLTSPSSGSPPGSHASLERGIQETLWISKARGNEPVCSSLVIYSLLLCSKTKSAPMKSNAKYFSLWLLSPSKLNLVSTYQHITNSVLNKISRPSGGKTRPK